MTPETVRACAFMPTTIATPSNFANGMFGLIVAREGTLVPTKESAQLAMVCVANLMCHIHMACQMICSSALVTTVRATVLQNLAVGIALFPRGIPLAITRVFCFFFCRSKFQKAEAAGPQWCGKSCHVEQK